MSSILQAEPLEFDFTSARELCETQHADRGMAGIRRGLAQLKVRAEVLLSCEEELETCASENGTGILMALSEEVDLRKNGGDDTEVLLTLPDAVVPELTAEVVQRLAARQPSEQEDEEPLEGARPHVQLISLLRASTDDAQGDIGTRTRARSRTGWRSTSSSLAFVSTPPIA